MILNRSTLYNVARISVEAAAIVVAPMNLF